MILGVFVCYILAHPGRLLPPDGPPPRDAAAGAADDVEPASAAEAQLQQEEGSEGLCKGDAIKVSVQDA